MIIRNKQFNALAFSLIVSAVLALAIGGCSSDDSSGSSGGSLPYTDDDGVAELTAVPEFPASTVSSSDSTMDVGFPVDSDSAKIGVYLHPEGDDATTPGFAIDKSITASTTNTVTLDMTGLVSGTVYYIELVICADSAATCVAISTTSSNESGYADAGDGTYNKFDMSFSTNDSTGVTIPTITAN